MQKPFIEQWGAHLVGDSVVRVDFWFHVTDNAQKLVDHTFHGFVVASIQFFYLL